MTQAKIEPGKVGVSLAGTQESGRGPQERAENKDLLPELGLKSPAKRKKGQPKAGPLNRGVELGD